MDSVSSRRQQGPAPSGRVSRFPVFEPWRDPRRRDARRDEPRDERRRYQHEPEPEPQPRLIAESRPMRELRQARPCRSGLHQLDAQNRLVTTRGVACRQCFIAAINGRG